VIAASDENVLGLEIAMHQALGVRSVYRISDGTEESERATRVQFSGNDQVL
jgi:hypothetical protein